MAVDDLGHAITGVRPQHVQLEPRGGQPLGEPAGFGYRCSFGLVQAQPGECVTAVLGRADAALYEAKRAGRDQCWTVE